MPVTEIEQEVGQEVGQDLLSLDFEFEPVDLIRLERNRGWLALKAEILKRCEIEERRLFTEILRTGYPADQRKIDEVRGMVKALRWAASLPEKRRNAQS